MTPRLLLRLGRVSNLPTVWTNVIAGMVLAGGSPTLVTTLGLALAASCLYVAGMILNDVHDVEVDRRLRPERPIPSGQIGLPEASRWGHGLLALGVVLATPFGWGSGLAAAVTAGCVLIYDRWHHGNPAAPVVMGLCRAGVIAIGACAVPAVDRGGALLGAALLAAYVISLTYVARFENSSAAGRRWPLVGLFAPWIVTVSAISGWLHPLLFGYVAWCAMAIQQARQGRPESTRRAVGDLIAGIALVDALACLRAGQPLLVVVCLAAFLLTLRWQQRVPGT
jgi:hypothetical protein